MVKRARSFASAGAAVLLLASCQQTPPAPDPSITLYGPSRPGENVQRADWVDPLELEQARQLGLEPRDAAFTEFADDFDAPELLAQVYFDFDQSFVRPEDRVVLQEAAAFLRNNMATRALVEGHCDWRGTTEYNLALGDRRAASVRDYLVQLGIAANRIESVSRGDLEASTEASDAGMQDDRRVDVLILD